MLGLLLGLITTQADTLRAFRTPASPAFVLLGVAPTAVERPATPQALVVSLISAVQDADFPPKHYALEVAPYWLTRHRTLTFEQYAAPGFWPGLLQTLSVSVATSSLAPDTGTSVGFGLRAAYVSGRDLSRVRLLRDSLLGIQAAMLRADSEDDERRLAAMARPMALRLQRALRTERLGFTIEGAAAMVLDFPDDIADNGKLGRAGVWFTSGYRITKPAVDLLTVIRFIRDERVAPAEGNLDLGARLLVDREDLTLAAEYIFRSVTAAGSSRSTYRLSIDGQYRLATEIYITAALGRDHAASATGQARLIAQVGIDFGLGALPILGP